VKEFELEERQITKLAHFLCIYFLSVGFAIVFGHV